MYVLKTDIYESMIVETKIEDFKEALRTARYTSSILRGVMGLSRHPSCTDEVKHYDYYMDSYNELCITVQKVKEK